VQSGKKNWQDQDKAVSFPVNSVCRCVSSQQRFSQIQLLTCPIETGAMLARNGSMSLIRTMSLIAGGALFALGGSALALFI